MIHNNIRPESFVFDEYKYLKLADFELVSTDYGFTKNLMAEQT